LANSHYNRINIKMKTKYKEEVEEIEEILCKVDRGEIRNAEAVYKLMKLTLKYKNARIKK